MIMKAATCVEQGYQYVLFRELQALLMEVGFHSRQFQTIEQ